MLTAKEYLDYRGISPNVTVVHVNEGDEPLDDYFRVEVSTLIDDYWAAKQESLKGNAQMTFEMIRSWAAERGIYKSGDVKTQALKFYEEAGELAQAVLKHNYDDMHDAIGDCIVVLTNLTVLIGQQAMEQRALELSPLVEDCIRKAYDVIIKRKGSMQNGTFVKAN